MEPAVIVSGATGRMGRAVAAGAVLAGVRLAGGIVRSPRPDSAARSAGYSRLETVEAAGPLIAEADAVIDFSSPDQLARLLDGHAEALAGRALIVGTTGLGDGERARLQDLSAGSPVLVAANFSFGVNLLLALAELAASRLAGDAFDVEVVETHHRGKADAPSGTALALGEAVARGRGTSLDAVRRDGRSGQVGARTEGEVGFHAVRGGDVAGEHRVLFLGNGERLVLEHAATDRSLFARGALKAAVWAVGREPGHYTMRDVLGL